MYVRKVVFQFMKIIVMIIKLAKYRAPLYFSHCGFAFGLDEG